MRLECRIDDQREAGRLRPQVEREVLRALGAHRRRIARVEVALHPEGRVQACRLGVAFSPAGSLSLAATGETSEEALAAVLERAAQAVRRELVRRRGLADARALLRPFASPAFAR